MISTEVSYMEENKNLTPDEPIEPEAPSYVPRPRWQIVLAWIALAIFIVGVVLYYYNIMTPY